MTARERAVLRAALALAVGACTSSPPSPQPRQPAAEQRVTSIVRETSFEDADLAARRMGRLDVVVRSTDRPTQVLRDAQVLVRGLRDTALRQTDASGLARFDSLPVGEHDVVVRRLGYNSLQARVPIKPGCRTDGEVYIAVSMTGIDPPAPTPGRITITTCR